jgi:hypothetical protein
VDGKRCFITIRYQNSTYIGGINFDDARICRKVCAFLGSYYGQPVEKIAQQKFQSTDSCLCDLRGHCFSYSLILVI